MIVVRLFTATGDFVTEVAIPPFRDLPGVVIWGQRVFCFSPLAGVFPADEPPHYREAFTYAVPPIG